MQFSPYEFSSTVTYIDESVGLRAVSSFSYYKFSIDEDMTDSEVYILKKDNTYTISSDWQIKTFDNYIVCYKT